MNLDAIRGKNILVVGDIMLDRYVYGAADRISEEAPVPIVRVVEERSIPGGAGNVASNITSLGGRATLIGALGNDPAGLLLKKELKKRKVILHSIIAKNLPTIQKIRVLARGQQLVRIDHETAKHPGEKAWADATTQFLKKNAERFDGFVISDYGKGMITRRIAETLIRTSRALKKPIIVDTKPEHAAYFTNATLITPNLKEACAMSGEKRIAAAGRLLQKKIHANVLITEGEAGMTLFEGKTLTHLPAEAREVFDVTGAGDTVVAAIALMTAAGRSLKDAAKVANSAAGIVVGKVGTATATLTELKKVLHEGK